LDLRGHATNIICSSGTLQLDVRLGTLTLRFGLAALDDFRNWLIRIAA
jgi:hypothetical protein